MSEIALEADYEDGKKKGKPPAYEVNTRDGGNLNAGKQSKPKSEGVNGLGKRPPDDHGTRSTNRSRGQVSH